MLRVVFNHIKDAIRRYSTFKNLCNEVNKKDIRVVVNAVAYIWILGFDISFNKVDEYFNILQSFASKRY